MPARFFACLLLLTVFGCDSARKSSSVDNVQRAVSDNATPSRAPAGDNGSQRLQESMLPSPSQMRHPASKAEDIKHFISVSGGNVMGKEMLKGLLNFYFLNMKKSFPDLPEKVFDDMRRIFEEEANIDELILMFVPIYDKYYTQEEIQEMSAFFESPVGQKMAVNSRQVVMECMAVSKIWGQKLKGKALPRIKARLKAEGISPNYMPEMVK